MLKMRERDVVLGIDPGSFKTGYGVIELLMDGTIVYITSGSIVPKVRDLAGRIATIYQTMQSIIQRYQPVFCAVEEVFVGAYPLAVLKLSHVRGGILLAAQQNHLKIAEYSARYVKQTIAGCGSADKQAVKKMVQLRLPSMPMTTEPHPSFDALDALAVAMTHALSISTASTRADRG